MIYLIVVTEYHHRIPVFSIYFDPIAGDNEFAIVLSYGQLPGHHNPDYISSDFEKEIIDRLEIYFKSQDFIQMVHKILQHDENGYSICL